MNTQSMNTSAVSAQQGTNLEKLLAMLKAADAVTIDDGSYLDHWNLSSTTGEPNAEIVSFTWTDGESDYTDTLTESAISEGVWDSEGKFVAKNLDGQKAVIRFFELKRLTKTNAGVSAARCFWQDLNDRFGALKSICDQYNAQTLADLMRLHQAILQDEKIAISDKESAVVEVVKAMPSAQQWIPFIEEGTASSE